MHCSIDIFQEHSNRISDVGVILERMTISDQTGLRLNNDPIDQYFQVIFTKGCTGLRQINDHVCISKCRRSLDCALRLDECEMVQPLIMKELPRQGWVLGCNP